MCVFCLCWFHYWLTLFWSTPPSTLWPPIHNWFLLHWNSFVTAEVILRAVPFSILVEISSWPLNLVVSRVESISNTSSSVHINGSGSPFGSVDGKSVDSNTGVEWLNELIKTLFSRLPFSRSEMSTIFGASRVEVLGGSQFWNHFVRELFEFFLVILVTTFVCPPKTEVFLSN